MLEGKRCPVKNTFYFDVQGNSEDYVRVIEGKPFLRKVKISAYFVTLKIKTVNNDSPQILNEKISKF